MAFASSSRNRRRASTLLCRRVTAGRSTSSKSKDQSGDLEFEFTVTAKPGKDGSPNFLGPLVQGPVGERFVYINIGAYAGQTDTCWSRRLKIPLSGIT
ncbi:MAG TPA: DUF5990 family protein [Pyrinomonadaceae bacterium]|nr:DUF5990 family protein [Pyrinomonadaceae bacterium]